MTVIMDHGYRPTTYNNMALEDRFEVLKEIGDGSFGSVALARVRANGAAVARRGTMVGVKNASSQLILTVTGCN
jgi:meiosis induction protein kinase IME2/SME1